MDQWLTDIPAIHQRMLEEGWDTFPEGDLERDLFEAYGRLTERLRPDLERRTARDQGGGRRWYDTRRA